MWTETEEAEDVICPHRDCQATGRECRWGEPCEWLLFWSPCLSYSLKTSVVSVEACHNDSVCVGEGRLSVTPALWRKRLRWLSPINNDPGAELAWCPKASGLEPGGGPVICTLLMRETVLPREYLYLSRCFKGSRSGRIPSAAGSENDFFTVFPTWCPNGVAHEDGGDPKWHRSSSVHKTWPWITHLLYPDFILRLLSSLYCRS